MIHPTRRFRGRVTAIVLVLAAALAGSSSAAEKHAQGKLSWALHAVASEAERGQAVRAQGRRYVREADERVVAVAELQPGARVEDIEAAVRREGGSIEAVAERWGWVKLAAPPLSLRRLAGHPAVRRLRTPHYPASKAVTSEGAAFIHAPEFVARTGFDGAGVTVAVLDASFKGLSEAIGSELPADTEVSEWVSGKLSEFDSPHGTACLEIVHDVAPGARLLALGFDDGVTYVNALETIMERRIPVVSHSIGFDNFYPPDGQSPFSKNVDILSRGGVLFVTAAGNEADNYYRGGYADADGDGLIEFAGGTEFLPIGVVAGGSGVVLRWDDPYGGSSHDYDLYIVKAEFRSNPSFEEGNPAIVASAQDEQNGSGDPVEYLSVKVDEEQVLYAVIRRDPATAVNTSQKLTLWAEASVHPDFRTAAGSLTVPADATGALSVGAVNLEGALEGFSSRGPTDDGRVKPDLAGPDRVTTAAYGDPFAGTSAATPHVAGAAALLLSQRPEDGVAALRQRLEKATASGGESARKNNDTGFGALDLNRVQ